MCWINGFVCAFRGIWRCVREEWHFRFHLVIAFYVLLFAPRFSLSCAEGAVLALTIGGVLVAEAINSAVERTVDRISTESHPLSGAAKDIAAGAVLLAAVTAVAVAVVLFWKPAVWLAIVTDWIARPYRPILLALSAVPSVLFIGKWGKK